MRLWRWLLAWLWAPDMSPGMFGGAFHPPLEGDGDSGGKNPPPPPPTAPLCPCVCHRQYHADEREAMLYGRAGEATRANIAAEAWADAFPAIDAAGPLEAAAACDHCRHRHCAALSGKPAELSGEKRRTVARSAQPWRDSDLNTVIPPPRESDSGGTTDGGGEGPE